jgi:mandelate racemase
LSADAPELTIRGLRVRALDLPARRPVETAAGVMGTVPVVLVDLDTEQGVTGRTYVRCYTPLALGATARLIADLEHVVAGRAAVPGDIAAELKRRFRLLGVTGLAAAAISGIDQAVWDARARASEVPLVKLLGGEPVPIPAYASLHSMEPRTAAAEAEEAAVHGFKGVKLKVGCGGIERDLEAIRAVRGAVGEGVELMADYNQSLDVEEALRRVPALEDCGLAWIEEPTRADDYAGHARITARARTPIQLGENWWGPEEMAKSIAAGASDHATLDVMRIGGVSGWIRAARQAETAQLPASSHTFPEVSVHLLAVTPTRHRLEYIDHAGAILAEPIEIRDGCARPPDRPGNGIEWNEPAIHRMAA